MAHQLAHQREDYIVIAVVVVIALLVFVIELCYSKDKELPNG